MPNRHPNLAGLILAAGASRRYGGVKQLAAFRGRPLIEHAVGSMEGVGLARFFVVLGSNAEAIIAGADLGRATVTIASDWHVGQSASLKAGIDAAAADPDLEGVVITLGDQPLIASEAIERVANAASCRSGLGAARATYGGRPGHPVLIGAGRFGDLSELQGDRGAAAIMAAGGAVLEVPCDGLGSDADADTPAELERLEAH